MTVWIYFACLDDLFSMSFVETSDHSDLEERIRKLNEELQREKMKAEALEKKKRKIKRSAMRKEALKLETELKVGFGNLSVFVRKGGKLTGVGWQ